MPVGGSCGDKPSAVRDQDLGRPGQHHAGESGDDCDDTPAAPGAAPQAQPQPAERNQQQPFRRQSRHRPDVARQGGDVLRDPDGNIDPPAHRHQRQPFEAEGHQQTRHDAPGQCPHRAQRHSDDIGERRIKSQVMEVVDRKRIGAERCDDGGDDHPAAITQDPARDRTAVQ